MGPGTHISDRINRGVLPSGVTDTIAMVHDINYLLADGDWRKELEADRIAIAKASYFDVGGILMKLGLSTKDLVGLQLSTQGSRAEGLLLKEHVLNNPLYQNVMQQASMNEGDFLH